mgnify:CR=1 FL=1
MRTWGNSRDVVSAVPPQLRKRNGRLGQMCRLLQAGGSAAPPSLPGHNSPGCERSYGPEGPMGQKDAMQDLLKSFLLRSTLKKSKHPRDKKTHAPFTPTHYASASPSHNEEHGTRQRWTHCSALSPRRPSRNGPCIWKSDGRKREDERKPRRFLNTFRLDG